ncbi:MAG: AMP-binding protein [Bacteroidia bacterium]|nr:AMP-binding protein [Bacteroidia bacterium]
MNYVEFCKLWDDETMTGFQLKTSGSTGEPKPILLEKKWLEYSAKQTQQTLGITSGKIFCCIPTDKVGGFMMMVRARVLGLGFEYAEPSSDPMTNLVFNHDCTFISLVPLQLKAILENLESVQKLNRFSHILIGGGPIDDNVVAALQTLRPAIYHTYAMTETYSHIALRRLNGAKAQKRFYPLPNVKVQLNESTCLQIQTQFSALIDTTDLAHIYPDGSFEILGRADFVINSGGIKILPERVEKLIAESRIVPFAFVISSKPDSRLGEKVVMVCNQDTKLPLNTLQTLKKQLPKYHNPLEIILVTDIPHTNNGKPDRKKLKQLLSHT